PTGDTTALVDAVREALDPATDRLARTDAARELVTAEYDSALQARRLRALAERSGHRHIPTQPIELPVPAPASPAPEQAEPPAAHVTASVAPSARLTSPVVPAARTSTPGRTQS